MLVTTASVLSALIPAVLIGYLVGYHKGFNKGWSAGLSLAEEITAYAKIKLLELRDFKRSN